MKILYGIQGTGYGHISRAQELIPELSKQASVDVMISGPARQLSVKENIKFSKHGISFSYDKNGGISMLETLRNLRPIRFIREIQSISLGEYDLIISDYEPVVSWSAKLEKIPSLALSHQASFQSPQTPRPDRKSLVAETILQHFAPADHAIGFHFKRYDDFIEPPIIRKPIRKLNTSNSGHITVYLPAYHHQVLQDILSPFTQIDWHIFSPSCTHKTQKENFRIYPVSNQPFLDSFASCSGIICNAGFETCAEAMFLGKKMLAIPIHNQYEQECNAAALDELGVMTMESLQGNTKEILHWLDKQEAIVINQIADPSKLVDQILEISSLGTAQKIQEQSSSFFPLIG